MIYLLNVLSQFLYLKKVMHWNFSFSIFPGLFARPANFQESAAAAACYQAARTFISQSFFATKVLALAANLIFASIAAAAHAGSNYI